MEPVENVNGRRWEESDLPSARGYASMEIVAGEPHYTSAYSCEYVRVAPGAHSVPHVEPWNHLLFFLQGSGEIVLGERTWPIGPGSYAKAKAGTKHSLRNAGEDELLMLAIYDPPRG